MQNIVLWILQETNYRGERNKMQCTNIKAV